jgi:hypothetical protein
VAGRGRAWQGVAGRGRAWQGVAGRGRAWQGVAAQSGYPEKHASNASSTFSCCRVPVPLSPMTQSRAGPSPTAPTTDFPPAARAAGGAVGGAEFVLGAVRNLCTAAAQGEPAKSPPPTPAITWGREGWGEEWGDWCKRLERSRVHAPHASMHCHAHVNHEVLGTLGRVPASSIQHQTQISRGANNSFRSR